MFTYPGVYARLWQGPAHLSGGHSSTINIPVIAYFAYGSTANLLFRGSIASLNTSKESPGYGDRFSPRILEIGPVIIKLTQFSQVQSEREWTLVNALENGYFNRGHLRVFYLKLD